MDLTIKNMAKSQSYREYRDDIDGLRAVAVVLVILFHAGISIFPSGFIGVDVFFTLSGYLITANVFRDIEREEFSISKFLNSRLWRLQPALIAMVTASLCFAAYCYIPEDFEVFTKSAKYTVLFLANQYFEKQSAAYASPDADLFLLLHTWSLAIEWQWYLILSLYISLIIFIAKSINHKKFVTILFCGWLTVTVISILGLIATNLLTNSQNYYSLLLRSFEFLIGGSAALFGFRIKSVNTTLGNILAFGAIFSIIWIATKQISVDFYPDEWTLFVCLATGVLFFSRNTMVNNFLSLTPLSYTGKISYSLYLWHWPVFSSFRYLGFNLSGKALIIALTITLLLAVVCYHCIESKFRKVRMSFLKSTALLVAFPIVFFLALHMASEKLNGIPQRFNDEFNASYQLQLEASTRASRRTECHGGDQDLNKCQFGDGKGEKTALLIGDSNANHFWGFFDVIGKDAGVKMYSLTTSTCLALPGIYQFNWWKYKNVNYKKCHDNTAKYYTYIRNNHYDFVIIGEIWSQYTKGPHLSNKTGDDKSDKLSKSRFETALTEAIKIIITSGAKPVVMYTIAGMPFNYQTCIKQHVIHRYAYDTAECDEQALRSLEDKWTLDTMDKMKGKFPELMFIDSKSIQCITGRCISNLDGVSVYRDEGHLTDYASYKFGETYIKQLGNPLK